MTVYELPATLASHETLEAKVVVSPRSRLRLGFGLREETPRSEKGRAAMQVGVVDSDGHEVTLLHRELAAGTEDSQGWQDETLNLDEFAGQNVTLRLHSEPLGDGLTLPVWSDPVVFSDFNGSTPPNFVMISIDTLRARSLGCYGYERQTSPFVDALAQAGTRFTTAFTTSATTGPAHMSLFTGLYPPRHGVLAGLFEVKPPTIPTLATQLRVAGYQTAAFTENGFLIRQNGFVEGFSQYTENSGVDLMSPPGQAQLTFSQATKWLRDNEVKPFFLFVHTYQVHHPYEPPKPYDELFKDDRIGGPADINVQQARDDYDREIRFTDDTLRDFVEEIKTAGLASNTILILLSDHGEEFAEHGNVQHGGQLFDEVLHIPLIFWGPGHIPKGQQIGGPASLVDVMPTLLEFAGIKPSLNLDGISLVPALLSGTHLTDRPIFAEARGAGRWKPDGSFEPWSPPLIALRRSDTKYILHRPARGDAERPVHYDLSVDPKESNPIPLSGELLAEVDREVSTYLAAAAQGSTPVPATTTPVLDSATREKLRQLGYLQ